MLGADDFTVGEVLTVTAGWNGTAIRVGDWLRVTFRRSTGLNFRNERDGISWRLSYKWVTKHTTQAPLRIVESWVDKVRTPC